MFTSTWKITLAGTVVLNFGDLLEAEPDMARSSVVQEVRPIRAAFSTRFPRGNVAHTVSFAKISVFDTCILAQAAKLNALRALPTTKGACVIEIDGSPIQSTLYNACLAPGAGGCRVEGQILHQSFQIIGGALTDTTPP